MMPPRSLLPGLHGTAGQQHQRHHIRMLLVGASVLTAMVLLVDMEGMQHRASTTTAVNPASMGLPGDTAVMGGSGAHWWSRWERRLKEQEERVGQWRERQRHIVYEETEAEEAMVASKAGAAAVGGDGVARADTVLAAKVAGGGDGGAGAGRLAMLLASARHSASLTAEAES